MDKENRGYDTSINSNDLRSEIVDKVSLNDGDIKTREVKVNLVDTLALNDLVKQINSFDIDKVDKRSEIIDKFSDMKKDFVIKDETPNDVNDTLDSFDNRSEILNKFNDDEISNNHNRNFKKRLDNVEFELEDTLALNVVVSDEEIKKIDEKDKRIELVGMVNDNNEVNSTADIKNKKELNDVEDSIKMDVDTKTGTNLIETVDEIKEEKIQENVENISLAMVILVVVSCLVVGVIVGYMLYKIAMNNSNMLDSVIDILHILM